MAFKSPKAIVEAAFNIGKAKTELSTPKMLVLGFLAGAFIAFGGLLAIVVGKGVNTEMLGVGIGKFIFGGVFPVGLMLVVIAGSELFTGNCGLITPACLAGKAKWSGLLKNWVFVYIGNLIGSLFVAYFLAYATGITTSEPWLSASQSIAVGKVSKSFFALFWRGVGCNWLVCLAVWLAVASDDIIGKVWGIWFPIMAFVALGFEHSIANMFFIPLGIFLGANVTWGQFFITNLIPVTLGNIVGGAGFVGLIYWWLYGRATE
jgi:formate/nitrite transporter